MTRGREGPKISKNRWSHLWTAPSSSYSYTKEKISYIPYIRVGLNSKKNSTAILKSRIFCPSEVFNTKNSSAKSKGSWPECWKNNLYYTKKYYFLIFSPQCEYVNVLILFETHTLAQNICSAVCNWCLENCLLWAIDTNNICM